MAELYADENYPLGIVERLRDLGHNVVTARDLAQSGRGVSDEEVLALATAHGRAVITHNRKDFFRLHRMTNGQHGGIIACTFDPDEQRQAKRISEAIVALGRPLAGELLRVYRPA
jgi:hypothetical protein